MSRAYTPYYERHVHRAYLRFMLDALLTRNKRRRIAIAHRQRDYLQLAGNGRLLNLHRQMNQHLDAARREWGSYDYGEGYFYQSLDLIGITGLRDTRARIEGMNLRERLAGRRVLEIGCNTGFVALSIADIAAEVVGFDINPHLVAIAHAAADHLGCTNTRFLVSAFEDLPPSDPYEAVLSFANHSTYDGNTRQSIEEYFTRCRDLLVPGGLLLFESHPPQHEGSGLTGVCEIIGQLFVVREQRILSAGTFLDRGRTFILAERP